MMIINDDSRAVNKLEASLTDADRVIIYDRQMFLVQATGAVFTTFHFLRSLQSGLISKSVYPWKAF